MATLSTRPGPFGDSYTNAPNALVIAARAGDARDAAEALALAGIRLAATLGFDAGDEIAGRPGIDLIVIEAAGAPEALLDSVLGRADAAAREHGTALVASIAEDQIDAVAAQLIGNRCQILCAPGMAERVAALTVAKAQAGAERRVAVDDATRDRESERLKRLNEEVARIADTLAQLTRGEHDEWRSNVRDPGLGYRGSGDGGPPPEVTPQEIRLAIRSRRLRGQFFQGELFADPAWDMLLDLFASSLEGRQVSVSSLCIAAAVPPTTALRWIGTLHDAGLFEREADPTDRRRAYIVLSAKGVEGMRAYLAAVKRQGLGIA